MCGGGDELTNEVHKGRGGLGEAEEEWRGIVRTGKERAVLHRNGGQTAVFSSCLQFWEAPPCCCTTLHHAAPCWTCWA